MFNPFFRMTIDEAMDHPFMEELKEKDE